MEKARLLSIQENNKIIKKQNEDKEKKAANEILESQDFLNDLLNQVDEKDGKSKKEDNQKNEENKKDNKTNKDGDKMDLE